MEVSKTSFNLPDDLDEVIRGNPQVDWARLFQCAIKDWQKEQENAKVGLELRYFVLQPRGATDHAKASRAAMRAYAYAVRDSNSILAQQVSEWADGEMRAAEIEELRSDAKGGSAQRGSGDGGDGAPPNDGKIAPP